MNTEVYYLPDCFNGSQPADTCIWFYTTAQSSLKNKVVFSQNLLCLLQQGTKQVYSSSRHIKATNDEILMLTGGSVLMTESVTEQNQFESMLLFFSNRFLADFCVKHSIALYAAAPAGPGQLLLKKDAFVRNFEQSLKLLKPVSNPRFQQLKLEELLLYLVYAYPDVMPCFFAHALKENKELKVQQTVLANIGSNLSVDELAFLCNMSVSAFKRCFAALFKTSPKKFFNHQRMEYAKQLLLQGKRTSEIFDVLGYESLYSFSSAFKKHFGTSPRRFQQEIGLNKQVFEPTA